MLMRYIYDGVSLKNGRAQNMDSMLLTTRTVAGCRVLLAVICDGVGSLADSATASGATVQLLNEWFSHIADVEQVGLRMRDAVLEINREIIRQTQNNGLKAATTLSALLLVNGSYYIVNAGDSRVYCFESNRLTQLTHDDISEEGKLTSCIGHMEQPNLSFLEGECCDKVFFLCSDGFYKRMDFNFLLSMLCFNNSNDIKKNLVRLIDFVMDQGERDNITVALVKNA